MTPGMFIVKNDAKCYGPFMDREARGFASKLHGEVEVIPLLLPDVVHEGTGSDGLQVLKKKGHRAYLDSGKIDTLHRLGGMTQDFYLTRREQRVLTARELDALWNDILEISRSVGSLMDYVEMVITDPSPENLVAMRKAFWRNRDSDDVDPHYRDRFW